MACDHRQARAGILSILTQQAIPHSEELAISEFRGGRRLTVRNRIISGESFEVQQSEQFGVVRACISELVGKHGGVAGSEAWRRPGSVGVSRSSGQANR